MLVRLLAHARLITGPEYPWPDHLALLGKIEYDDATPLILVRSVCKVVVKRWASSVLIDNIIS